MTGRRVDSLAAAGRAANMPPCSGRAQCHYHPWRKEAPCPERAGGVKSPIPCFPSIPADTTGAGDALTALAARLAYGETAAYRGPIRGLCRPSAIKSRAHHLYWRITGRHENGFCVPPRIIKWHKPCPA